jgi:hypothetical protein
LSPGAGIEIVQFNRFSEEYNAMSHRFASASSWLLGTLKKVAIALWRAA